MIVDDGFRSPRGLRHVLPVIYTFTKRYYSYSTWTNSLYLRTFATGTIFSVVYVYYDVAVKVKHDQTMLFIVYVD